VLTPVTLDQLVSSGSNALAVLVGGFLLDAGQLATFALVMLGATSAVALQRSAILEPAMTLGSPTQWSDLHRRWLAVLSGGGLSIGLVVSLTGLGPTALFCAGCILVPLAQDVLRYRAIGDRRPIRALEADLLWLAGFGAVIAFRPPTTAVSLLIAWSLSALVGIPFLLRRRGTATLALRRVFELGRYQLADQVVATVGALVPFLAVEVFVTSTSTGAFRLAQTMMGPLNILAVSTTLTMLVGGGTIRSLRSQQLRAALSRTTHRLVALSTIYAGLIWLALFAFSSNFDSGVRSELRYAFPTTAIGALFAMAATVYVASYRVFAQQRRAVRVRLAVLGVTVSMTAVGIVLQSEFDAPDALLLPVMGTGIANLVFWRMSWRRLQLARSPCEAA